MVTTVLLLTQGVLFAALHRLKKPVWDVALRIHIAMLPVPLMLAVAPRLGPALTAVLFGIYLAPTLFVLSWWHGEIARTNPTAPGATSFRTES